MELSEITSIQSAHKLRKSPSTYVNSKAVSVSTSEGTPGTYSKSEAQSYRDRLRERFESVKKQAKTGTGDFKTASKNVALLRSSLKVLRDENEQIEAEISTRRRHDDFEEYMFFCENTEEKREEDVFEETWEDPRPFRYKTAEQLGYVIKLQEEDYFWQPKR